MDQTGKDIEKRPKQEVRYSFSPNMSIDNADMRQSTLHRIALDGSIVANSSFRYSEILNVNMQDSAFARVTLDNAMITHCSLKNVTIAACDVEGLVINGVKIGDLFVKSEEK